MRIYELILFAGHFLLSISSVLGRPDVIHLSESQKLDNQYASLVTPPASLSPHQQQHGNVAGLSTTTTTGLRSGDQPQLAIGTRILPPRPDGLPTNGDGILHNYGVRGGAGGGGGTVDDVGASQPIGHTAGAAAASLPSASIDSSVRISLLRTPPTIAHEADEHGNRIPQTSRGDLLQGEQQQQRGLQLSFGNLGGGAASTTIPLGKEAAVASSSDVASNRIGNLRRNIPGVPNVDYPIFSQPPETSFECTGRHDGYYADVEARCQVFRVCANTDLTGQGFAFLCPNGTLFNQRYFVCDWYNRVNCSESEQFYGGNEGKHIMDHADMMEQVKQMLEYPLTVAPPPPPPFHGHHQTATAFPPPPPPATFATVTRQPLVVAPPPPSLPHNPPAAVDGPSRGSFPSPSRTADQLPPSSFLPPQFPAFRPDAVPNVVGSNDGKDLLPPPSPGNRDGSPFETTRPAVIPSLPAPPPPQLPVANVDPPLSGGTDRPPSNGDDDENEKQNTDALTRNEPKVYVSSLGELSTDVNSGFDINKSRFLVVNDDNGPKVVPSEATEQQLQQERAKVDKRRLERILEEQVALVGQAINSNGLTRQAQINSALLASTNRFATKTTTTSFLPRLIASNVIVPLPKGFNKNGGPRPRGDSQSDGQVNRLSQADAAAAARPTYTATEFRAAEAAPSTGQFPAEQFSFPSVAAGHHVVAPPPFPSAVGVEEDGKVEQLSAEKSENGDGDAAADDDDEQQIRSVSLAINSLLDSGRSSASDLPPSSLLPAAGFGLGVVGGVRTQELYSRSYVDGNERVSSTLAESSPNNDADHVGENGNGKQRFTYPVAKDLKSEQDEQQQQSSDTNYADKDRLRVYVPTQSLEAPRDDISDGGGDDDEDDAEATPEDDQQIANSAVSQIVFREPPPGSFYPRSQQVFPSSNSLPFFSAHNGRGTIDVGHVPTAQSRAFAEGPDGGAAAEQPPFIRNSYAETIINNVPRAYHNFNSISATPLPRTLPSVTQSWNGERVQQHSAFQSGSLNRHRFSTSGGSLGGGGGGGGVPFLNRPAVESRVARDGGGGNDESVVVKIVPALGFHLNDPKERAAYYEAVQRGLLSDNGFVYVNKVQQLQADNVFPQSTATHSHGQRPFSYQHHHHHQRQPQRFQNLASSNFPISGNTNSIFQQQLPARNELRLFNRYNNNNNNQQEKNFYNNPHLNNLQFNYRGGGEESPNKQRQDYLLGQSATTAAAEGAKSSIFQGINSYTVPINSVGRLENDSDSVSGAANSFPTFNNFRGRRRAQQ